jgi:hypothetical protein
VFKIKATVLWDGNPCSAVDVSKEPASAIPSIEVFIYQYTRRRAPENPDSNLE